MKYRSFLIAICAFLLIGPRQARTASDAEYVARCVEYLRSDSNEKYYFAIEELPKTENSPAKIESLKKALKSDDLQQQRLAAALLCADKTHEPSTRAIDLVIDTLKQEHRPWLSYTTRDLLVEAPDPTLIKRLEKALDSKDDRQRYLAYCILEKNSNYKNHRRLMKAHVNQLADDTIAINAYNAGPDSDLAKKWPKEYIEELKEALKSKDHQMRQFAANALINTDAGKNPSATLVKVLVEGLRSDQFKHELYNAVEYTRYLVEHPAAGTKLLEQALDSEDPQQQFLAAFILGATGRRGRIGRVTEILIPNLKDDEVSGNGIMATHALFRLGKPVLKYLKPYADSRNQQQKEAVRLIILDLTDPPKPDEIQARTEMQRMSEYEPAISLPPIRADRTFFPVDHGAPPSDE